MSDTTRDQPARGVYLHTFGCQMNVYDANRILERLAEDGYHRVETPEEAELVLLNTCSVREKAEQKLLSSLGRLALLKQARPELLVAVSGCVAQQERERLLKKAKVVDLVFGPDAVPRVRELVRRSREEKGKIVDARFTEPSKYAFPRAMPAAGAEQGVTAFVTIQKGCDKVCTYCIVPFTRGREVSRPREEILEEARAFLATGVRELTLIGQNVNCYHGGSTFAELLRAVAELPGLARLRYTTSYPGEMGDDVFAAHRDLPVLCRHLHLPVQSGSDRILELMRREHSAAEYREKVARLRALVPGIAITTDILVGFPGESDEDFEATMALIEELRFDNLYSFVYSERPGTWTARNGASLGEVPQAVKVERLERVQARQREISLEKTSAFVGQTLEILVEGPSRKDPAVRAGHASEGWTVHFPGTEAEAPVGSFARVRIDSASHFGLRGELVSVASEPDRGPGS
ncbi:MAG: tRNA (N6-isopentenyl adenosine(37)-C2)-methylthiotransferase MiaB [Deltaproteobacteria bacterium]|nr:tRNA (N6-isopentenyl adenosine(37)-C2)-methylthiotransferase MiaB [Deltaproteobacteria bacterium]